MKLTRDESLKELKNLRIIDSIEDKDLKAKSLNIWVIRVDIESFDLKTFELKELQELYYKLLKFMKDYTGELKSGIVETSKIKLFMN